MACPGKQVCLRVCYGAVHNEINVSAYMQHAPQFLSIPFLYHVPSSLQVGEDRDKVEEHLED